MSRRSCLIVLVAFLGTLVVISTSAETKEKTKEPEFSWVGAGAAKPTSAKKLGILFINYKEGPSGRVELSTEYAISNHVQWMQYKPEVYDDILGTAVSSAVAKEMMMFDASPLRITEVISMPPGKTVKDGMALMAAADIILVFAAGNARCGLISWVAGGETPYVNGDVDCVLCTPDGKVLAIYAVKLMKFISAVGKIDKDFDSAQPLEQKVSFRYRIDEFTKAFVEDLRATVEKAIQRSFRNTE